MFNVEMPPQGLVYAYSARAGSAAALVHAHMSGWGAGAERMRGLAIPNLRGLSC